MDGSASDELARLAAERVREVITEAERRAEEIVREAEREAERIRARAHEDEDEDEPAGPQAPPREAEAPAEPAREGDAAARLVAMKLALEGKGAKEIEAELEARLGAADRGELVREVLDRAGRV